jgi:CopG family transcriptional regulator, nickel-responsive regulator
MNESNIKRFGVSMDGKLLDKFDESIKEQGYENRSEAFRDLVRDALVKQSLEAEDKIVAGCILLFYRHHHRNLLEDLARIQHEMHDSILATTHFHLDQDNCLEMIVVKGKRSELRALSDQMTTLKGVTYGKFTVAPLEEIHT